MPLKYNHTGKLVVFAILLFGLWACKNQSASAPESGAVPTYETEEFKNFYEKFGKDSAFQMAHIVFPLEGMQGPKDTLEVPDPNFRWKQEDWVIHKPYDDMNGTFTREILDIKGIVIERISDQSGKYTMERRFGKLSSGWHMIYYRELGMY